MPSRPSGALRAALTLVLLALAAAAASPAAAAVTWGGCPAADLPANVVVQCARVAVPLDPAQPDGASLELRVARARRAGAAIDAARTLLFLPDGAGAAGWWGAAVPFRRLALPDGWTGIGLDLRGTGATALRCPALQAQALAERTRAAAGSVEACGALLGDARARYGTADAVIDLEAVRLALGIPRFAGVWGVGTGAHVASRYARAYPAGLRRVILEAPVPAATGVDPLARASLAAAPRVLSTLCGRACAPARVLRALRARARAARTVDLGRAWGARRRVRVDDVALLDVLVAGSTSGDLTDVPAALLADAAGDGKPLARLVLRARGRAVAAAQRSRAAAVAATCLDATFPWGGADAPLDGRAAALAARIAGLAAAATGPFPRTTAGRSGVVDACARWPVTPDATAAVPAPPDTVGALVISGDLDLATPAADADREAKAWGAARLRVANGFHGWLAPDGCGEEVRRFLAGRSVGSCGFPRFWVRPAFARGVATTAPIAGSVPGRPGRILAALRDTVLDAAQAAGRGETAGLRAGTIRVRGTRLVLTGVAFVRGLVVSGTLDRAGDGLGDLVGELRLTGAVRTTAVLARGRWDVPIGGVPYWIRFDGGSAPAPAASAVPAVRSAPQPPSGRALSAMVLP